jgi:hypothetical protein
MTFGTVLAGQGTHVPVDPGAKEAQRLLLNELSRPEYRASQPTWFDRLSSAVFNWLSHLFVPKGPAGAFPTAIVLVLVVVAIVVLFFVFGLPRLTHRSTVQGSLFGEDDSRSAAQMMSAARVAAASADWSLAIAEGFRSMARSLAERELVATFPGTTAHDFAIRAGAIFTLQAASLAAAADSFDGVRYLGAEGTEANWRAIEQLAAELLTARPVTELIPA